MARTICLVCLISTVNGRSKKRSLGRLALVAGTQQNLKPSIFLFRYLWCNCMSQPRASISRVENSAQVLPCCPCFGVENSAQTTFRLSPVSFRTPQSQVCLSVCLSVWVGGLGPLLNNKAYQIFQDRIFNRAGLPPGLDRQRQQAVLRPGDLVGLLHLPGVRRHLAAALHDPGSFSPGANVMPLFKLNN